MDHGRKQEANMETVRSTQPQDRVNLDRRHAVLAALLLAASMFGSGCGGGGGGSDSDFAGVWNGGASLVEDTCGIYTEFQSYISFTHLVNETETSVVLDNGALSFTGAATGPSSFTASTTRATSYADSECAEKITWRYEEVKRDQAPFVIRSSIVSCPASATQTVAFECKSTFSGSAYRATSGGGGGPIAVLGEDTNSGPMPIEDGAATGAATEPAGDAATSDVTILPADAGAGVDPNGASTAVPETTL